MSDQTPYLCPQCHSELPAMAPRGLCPTCLMAAAAAPTEPSLSRKQRPPSIEAVAAAFPNLEILEWIGQGGMGAVYKARQPRLNRFVALKILPESLGQDSAFAERFLREGQMLARLNHPNIVAVHDFGQAGGYFYLLMEFVDGVNLRQAMSAGRFTPGQALAIVPKICEALQFAHDEGVLHRDIKPENILLDAKGRVKLVDFGIAKLIGSAEVQGVPATLESGAALTQSGAALGTPNYMAPEQMAQPSGVDHRADIYSLGVVFYELLTGELPKGDLTPPSARAAVTSEIDTIVLRALEKERALRQQSATELKTEVETLISNAVSNLTQSGRQEPPVLPAAQSSGNSDRPSNAARRWALAGWVGGALVIVLVIGALVRISSRAHVQLQANSDPALPEPPARLIELDRGWVQTNASAVTVMSQSTIRPDESIVASVRHVDGRSVAAASGISFLKRGAETSTTLSFSWHFPEGFGLDHQNAAWDSIRAGYLHRALRLVAGKPFQMFSVTNEAGGVFVGFIEYRVVPSKGTGARDSNGPVRALVRLKPKSPMPGWLSLDYSVEMPPGHRVLGSSGGTAMADGEANTQLYLRSALTDATCVWFVRGEFKLEHFKQGVEQLEQLRSRGPVEITLGTPARLFSLTNALGDTFDGYLELVGPGSANPNGVPPMTYGVVPTALPTRPPETVAPPAPLPTVDEMRHVGEQIATGDQAAFEKLLEISQSLYRGIDYQKERDRVITNLNLMSAAFEVLGQSIATGNQASLDTVERSLTVPHLKAFAPRALGLAAAAGHEESLDLLLNFKESGILLSSAVSALGPAAAKNNDLAVHFLAGVIDDNSSKALWYLAAKGLRPAAAAGNAEAKAAVEKYDSLKRP